MKKLSFLLTVVTLFLAQGASVTVASDFNAAGLQLAAYGEEYGCCLVKTDDQAADVWEYEDDISFADCYRLARFIGNPFQFLNHRKYEFYKDQRCSSVKGHHELIPTLWSPEYHNG